MGILDRHGAAWLLSALIVILGATPSSAAPADPPAALMDEVDQPGVVVPEPKPMAGEPADLFAMRARIIRGDRSMGALKALQKLSYKYPKNFEAAYMLGLLYCTRLWMGDGMEALRKAIRLEPSLRWNPYLIKSVIPGLGNDGDHLKVKRFLVQDIGKPAVPFVAAVLKGSWRQQVKDRATAVLQALK